MRSKTASQTSPETGGARPDGPDKRDKRDGREARDARDGKRQAIELEVTRNRYLGWAVLGTVVGALLVWKLGTVGVWIGFLMIGLGALRAWQLVQTFLHPPGTIVVSEREVVLPRGLCMPRPVTVRPDEVTAVYFLRRSVPWNRSAPVLVVEIGAEAMAFPRDWFASEADQRHVVHALLRAKGGAGAATGAADAAAAPAGSDDSGAAASAEATSADPAR